MGQLGAGGRDRERRQRRRYRACRASPGRPRRAAEGLLTRPSRSVRRQRVRDRPRSTGRIPAAGRNTPKARLAQGEILRGHGRVHHGGPVRQGEFGGPGHGCEPPRKPAGDFFALSSRLPRTVFTLLSQWHEAFPILDGLPDFFGGDAVARKSSQRVSKSARLPIQTWRNHRSYHIGDRRTQQRKSAGFRRHC